jgi:hypothetical protein
MEKRAPIFSILVVTFLFAFACVYSPFDRVREADFLSHKKYEDRDIEDLYAEKGSSLDGTLVSPALFPPFLDTYFASLPSVFLPNTHLVTTFSVLRC